MSIYLYLYMQVLFYMEQKRILGVGEGFDEIDDAMIPYLNTIL